MNRRVRLTAGLGVKPHRMSKDRARPIAVLRQSCRYPPYDGAISSNRTLNEAACPKAGSLEFRVRNYVASHLTQGRRCPVRRWPRVYGRRVASELPVGKGRQEEIPSTWNRCDAASAPWPRSRTHMKGLAPHRWRALGGLDPAFRAAPAPFHAVGEHASSCCGPQPSGRLTAGSSAADSDDRVRFKLM